MARGAGLCSWKASLPAAVQRDLTSLWIPDTANLCPDIVNNVALVTSKSQNSLTRLGELAAFYIGSGSERLNQHISSGK